MLTTANLRRVAAAAPAWWAVARRWIEQLNRSESGATSHTAMSRCARLSGTRERQSVMLTTLLVIVASIAAGMIVHQRRHERREW
jgi:hypothetical protein